MPPSVLEPWSPIVDPLLSQCPPRRSIRAFALVMLVALEPCNFTAAILPCRVFLFLVDLSGLDVMRCLTVPPLIP